MRIIQLQGKNLKEELNRFLVAYRTTPHSTTGKAPAELLYQRRIRSKLPELININRAMAATDTEDVRITDERKKRAGKEYGDSKRHARYTPIEIGDTVLVQQKEQNKLDSTYNPELYTVTERKGNEVTIGLVNRGSLIL